LDRRLGVTYASKAI